MSDLRTCGLVLLTLAWPLSQASASFLSEPLPRGFLMPIGGGASTGNENQLKEAHIAIHREAAQQLDEHRRAGASVGNAVCTLEYREQTPDIDSGLEINRQLFLAAGVSSDRIFSFYANSRDKANDSQFVQGLKVCGLFYIPGGDQNQIYELWNSTRLQTQIQETLRLGGGVMGKSAGAAVQGTHIYSPDLESATSARAFLEKVEIKETEIKQKFLSYTLKDLPALYVETHTGDRERTARALAILAYLDQRRSAFSPRMIGLAADSDTAALIHYDWQRKAWTAKVIGARAVEFLIPDQRVISKISSKGQASYWNMPSALLLQGNEIGLSGKVRGALLNNKSMDGPLLTRLAKKRVSCLSRLPSKIYGDLVSEGELASDTKFLAFDPISKTEKDLDSVEYAYLTGDLRAVAGEGCGFWQTNAFSLSSGNPEHRLNVQRYALGSGQSDFSFAIPASMMAYTTANSKTDRPCYRFESLEQDYSSSIFVMDTRVAQQLMVSQYIYREFGATRPVQVGGWFGARIHLLAPEHEICLFDGSLKASGLGIVLK